DALRLAVGDAALDALIEAGRDREEAVGQAAVRSVAGLPHPRTTERLLRELEGAQSPAAPQQEPPAESPKKGKGKGNAASQNASDAWLEEKRQRRQMRRWLATALGERQRGDRTAAERETVARALVPLLRDEMAQVRQATAHALGWVGPV